MAEYEHHQAPIPWALGTIAMIALCVWTWRAIGKTIVAIYADGIRRQTIFGINEVRWDEITDYRFTAISVAGPGALGAIGAVVALHEAKTGADRSLILRLMSGKTQRMRIDSNVKLAAEAIDLIIQRINQRVMPELARRLVAGETLRFGPLELGPRGFGDVGDPLALAQLSIEFSGTRLRVKQKGKLFAATSAETAKIPNVVALCDLLRARGVKVPELRPIVRA